MVLASQSESSMKEQRVIVELPEDMAAKKESHNRQKGSFIKDSLRRAVDEMESLKHMGKNYPEGLEE